MLSDYLQFGVTHSRVEKVLRGLQVMHGFKELSVNAIGVYAMLLNGNDRASFYHGLVGIIVTLGLVPMLEGNYVLSEHVGTRGLACSLYGLEILSNVDKGLLRVFVVPLGPVLPVKVVLMLGLSSTLKV